MPATRAFPERTLGELKNLPVTIPKLGADTDVFESDVKAVLDLQPCPPKGAHDLIIAATVISLGFSLATLDLRDYGPIEGLSIAGL